ncbi:major facilitator superfamily domain-containing protein [Massariosphaeria phaeospora]|uniref:Major facilitator superfamily domain-containing protein n=1 Tax=Massariosphaeria phaeospora TaxID=100035 RepID=A0A7C8IEZ0_9PLEO|nr:major facilitator superfamily domain-containing protein [Massariosphaeria phaeospora]
MATPNPHDFATRGPAVLAVTATTLVVCSVFVALRLISRVAIVRKTGWDDYTIILAWILAFGTSFSICYGTTKGLGRHAEDIPAHWLSPMKKAAYTFSVLYNPALMTTKTSILLFYLTLSKTQKSFRWTTIATLIVVNVGGLALSLVNILQCQPVSAAFETPVPDSATCTNIVTIYLSSAPLNIVTDLAILFLPMPILTSMRLPKKQKIILIATFGFGVFVAAVDVVRIAYLQTAARENLRATHQNESTNGTDSRNSNDFSWYASFSFMWSAIEINVGIMCGCVPALKPLVHRFLPHWLIDQTLRNKSVIHTSDDSKIPNVQDSRRLSNMQTVPQSPSSHDRPLSPTAAVPKPPPVLRGANEPMGMMDFLTTPDMNEMPRLNQMNTATTALTRQQSHTFFDFVNVGKKKNITLRSNRESIYPVMMVTVLFFVWGFAYGLLDTLNAQFQAVANMTNGQTIGHHSAYYAGYIAGPLTFGRLVFRHWGFKACYMVGLMVYACGALVFWPSAVLTSFPAFLISNFITGLGLSTLEISANPFIALCGPPEYAEVRLNISQAIQAIGSIVSPLLAKKVLFQAEAENLINVQWAYLGISFFTVLLGIIYFYVHLPEATDEELENASARMPIPRDATVKLGSSHIKVIWISLGVGVFSLFCFVGGQESIATTFEDYVGRVMPSIDPVSHHAVGHTAFAVSRFVAALANIWLKPRYVLLFFFAGSIAFAAATMSGSGPTPSTLIIMTMFFQGPLFPQIYAQALRGLGKHTKDAAILLTAAIGGGGVFPPIMYAATQAHNVQYAYCVVVAAFAAGALFPLWLNLNPTARKLADPVRDEKTRRESQLDLDRRDSEQQFDETFSKSKRWSKMKHRYADRDGGRDHQMPAVEHRERRSWPQGQGQDAKDEISTMEFATVPLDFAASPGRS